MHILAICIDLSKAFDTIDHFKLLQKLNAYGIRGVANDLLKSYLTDRAQQVSVNGTLSDMEQVKFGVPQGSVLGPLLFLLYINDLKFGCNNLKMACKFILYADDTNMFIECEDLNTAFKNANQILKHVLFYMKTNLLHINLDKSCYMWFKFKRTKSCLCKTEDCAYFSKSNCTSNNKVKFKKCKQTEDTSTCFNESPIWIGKSKIKMVTDAKYLGVYLDQKLTWRVHIDKLSKKLASSIAVLKRISTYIPSDCRKSLYHTLFESHINYGISVWGKTCKRNIDTIFRLQKKCTRILFGDLDQFLDKYCTAARTQ